MLLVFSWFSQEKKCLQKPSARVKCEKEGSQGVKILALESFSAAAAGVDRVKIRKQAKRNPEENIFLFCITISSNLDII